MNTSTKQVQILQEKDVYMSPKKVLRRMGNIIVEYGFEKASTANAFQQAREAWIAAIFMINQTYMTDKLYWLQANPVKHDIPDILAVSYRAPRQDGEIGIVQEFLRLEVSEYHEQSNLSLSDSILKKVPKGKYQENTTLLYYLDTHTKFQFIINDVIADLDEAKPDIAQVWLIFHPENKPVTVHNMVKVYPGNYKGYQQLNYLFLLEQQAPIIGSAIDFALFMQPDFIKPQRGGKSNPQFEYLGPTIIPLPKDKK